MTISKAKRTEFETSHCPFVTHRATAWNEMGADQGAVGVREVIDYLLRGRSPVDTEDRLTLLINDAKSVGMKGFKESLLTKVLCVT